MSYSETITYEDLRRILNEIPMAVFTYGRGEVGEIKPFAGSTIPTGWLPCHGQAVSRTDYEELFDVIGTTYGTGDGSTTFNVPDLRNRFMVGVGDEYSLNSKGGEKTHKLTINEMPKHDHDLQFQGYGNENFNLVFQYGTYSNTGKYPTNGGYMGYRGGDQAHENRPPYIGINFIIYAKNTKSVASPQIDLFYPVGSYYETSDANFDPNVTWGGTWVLETSGQVHVSAGTGYNIGDTGGEATHTLTVNEMPHHRHDIALYNSGYSQQSSARDCVTTNAWSDRWSLVGDYMDGVGRNDPHNNMQPYIVVNRWHRTA